MSTPDWARLCAEVLHYADRNFPGYHAIVVTIRHPGSEPVTIPVPLSARLALPPANGEQPARADSGLTERQDEIMQVFREAGPEQCLTAEEAARRVGCEPTKRFRENLATLSQRLHLLRSTSAGYFLQ